MWVKGCVGGAPWADTNRTVDVVQHISDRSHAQVSVHDNLDPSGCLIVMEFVTASLEGQEPILPAEILKMGVKDDSGISPEEEIFLIPSRLISFSSKHTVCRCLVD